MAPCAIFFGQIQKTVFRNGHYRLVERDTFLVKMWPSNFSTKTRLMAWHEHTSSSWRAINASLAAQ